MDTYALVEIAVLEIPKTRGNLRLIDILGCYFFLRL